MKKLTFKVSSSKDSSVVSLIKDINKISCRIFLDIENGFVVVENVNDSMIENVIDLVDNYYTILNINIDNTFKELTEESTIPVTTEAVDEAVEEPQKSEMDDVVVEKQPKILEPQSEDDLIIKKVEFESEYVETHINNFLKTAYWALYNRRATEKDIGNYIFTCMSEISMRYSPKPIIEFSLGDIVDVNYGSHLPGEIQGGHVNAIVCNILNKDMAYIVPITKVRTDITSRSYLLMDIPHDATYDNEFYRGGTILIDKGKYVRAERFNSVVGKTTPTFFEKLLYQLASTFDFTEDLSETVEDSRPLFPGEIPDEIVDTPVETEETAEEVAETPVKKSTDKVVKSPAEEMVKPKTTAKKVTGEESVLLEVIGFALDKLDSSKKVEEQVEPFLTDIGMTTTERMVTQAFIVACDIKKINYENVILGLHETFPKVKEEIIKNVLKEAFKNWLNKYPTLAEKCPRISLMAVLKVFAKRFA